MLLGIVFVGAEECGGIGFGQECFGHACFQVLAESVETMRMKPGLLPGEREDDLAG